MHCYEVRSTYERLMIHGFLGRPDIPMSMLRYAMFVKLRVDLLGLKRALNLETWITRSLRERVEKCCYWRGMI